MEKVKVKLYPYMSVDLRNGGSIYHNAYRWPTQQEFNDREELVMIPLGELEIEFNAPTGKELDAIMLEILSNHRTQLQAKHQATLTRLKFLENQLLGLAAPDVLDKNDTSGSHATPISPDDSDIPF